MHPIPFDGPWLLAALGQCLDGGVPVQLLTAARGDGLVEE
jgi:hypothetical protein